MGHVNHMTLWMSNALLSAALAGGQLLAQSPSAIPTTQAAPKSLYDPLIPLMAAGLLTLLVWTVRRLANREKLMLRHTPGRANSLTPAHILMLMGLWLILVTAAGGLPTPEQKLAGQVVVQIALLVSCLVVAKRTFRLGVRRGLGLRMDHWLFDTCRAVLGYLAIVPICILLNILFTWLLWDVKMVHEHVLLRMLVQLSCTWKAVAVLSGVVLAPLAEEAMFRGLLQSMLRQVTGKPWLAVLVTSVVFALVHFASPQNVPAIFALSVVLGYNYERCGRLYPVMLLHAIFNAVFMAIALANLRGAPAQ